MSTGYYGDFANLAEEQMAYNNSVQKDYESGRLSDKQLAELRQLPLNPDNDLPF